MASGRAFVLRAPRPDSGQLRARAEPPGMMPRRILTGGGASYAVQVNLPALPVALATASPVVGETCTLYLSQTRRLERASSPASTWNSAPSQSWKDIAATASASWAPPVWRSCRPTRASPPLDSRGHPPASASRSLGRDQGEESAGGDVLRCTLAAGLRVEHNKSILREVDTLVLTYGH